MNRDIYLRHPAAGLTISFHIHVALVPRHNVFVQIFCYFPYWVSEIHNRTLTPHFGIRRFGMYQADQMPQFLIYVQDTIFQYVASEEKDVVQPYEMLLVAW